LPRIEKYTGIFLQKIVDLEEITDSQRNDLRSLMNNQGDCSSTCARSNCRNNHSSFPSMGIVLWVQQFANAHACEPELAVRERRQLYVAMTCAQEELYVFCSGEAPILNE
jgi:hypothetical protein